MHQSENVSEKNVQKPQVHNWKNRLENAFGLVFFPAQKESKKEKQKER